MKTARWFIMMVTGCFFVVCVGIEYLPDILKYGMYEFELTFLSNIITGLFFICGGIYGIRKKRELPQILYLNSIVTLQLVFMICMVFISEFNFSGGYIFLHIVNPILATIEFFSCTSCKKVPSVKVVMTGLIFPVVYFIYVIVYGYQSGYWIYGILNIPERGILFVAVLACICVTGIILLEFVQYKINYLLSRNRDY